MAKPKERDARLMEALDEARRRLGNVDVDVALCQELADLVPFVSSLLELGRRHPEELLALEAEDPHVLLQVLPSGLVATVGEAASGPGKP